MPGSESSPFVSQTYLNGTLPRPKSYIRWSITDSQDTLFVVDEAATAARDHVEISGDATHPHLGADGSEKNVEDGNEVYVEDRSEDVDVDTVINNNTTTEESAVHGMRASFSATAGTRP